MRRSVRVAALLVVAGALVCSLEGGFLSIRPAAAQDAAQLPPARPRRPPVELSELIAHSPVEPCVATGPASVERSPLRLATWNIRAARAARIEDIAADVRSMRADVIALQEVDVLANRTGQVDQPRVMASALNYHYAFTASIKWDGGDYGLALLSRWPLSDVRRHRVVSAAAGEPRIVLEATICVAGKPLRLFNHHADVRQESREAGFIQIADLVRPAIGQGIVLLGDFNEQPSAPGVLWLLSTGLVDLEPQGTTTADGRIDYLLMDGPLRQRVSATEVWRTTHSDHHAVFADLLW